MNALSRMLPRALVLTVALSAFAGALPGCQRPLIDDPDAPVYPLRSQTRSLDIQVTRDETQISMTNTTPQPLPAGRMWINTWYFQDVPALGVGESMTLDLGDFVDRYGDDFRAGGFFATDRPDQLALVQLETPDELLGFIVVGIGDL